MSIFAYLIILFKFSIFLSQKCTNYQNYCDKCNPITNLCMKCQSELFIPDENGGCKGAKKCSIEKNYCDECEISGELCQKCEIGYFPDKNGGCSYTENCKISYKGECLECDSDFILLGKEFEFKICKSLNSDDLKNCEVINKEKGYCFACEDGYNINGGDRKCTKIENCYESKYGICVSCNYGYFLNKKENKCYPKTGELLYCKQSLDGKTCDLCDEFSYFDENGFCVNNNFCSESINETCTKCISNYYLARYNNACSNDKNCYQAEGDTGFCSYCESDYYLDIKDYKCKSNQEDDDFKFCQKVENSICKSCIQGYRLSKDSKCTSSEKCIGAENGKCILCEENYYLGLDNKCTNIKHCIYSNNYNQCVECEDNYYYFPLNRTCLESKGIFEHCKTGYEKYCTACKNNYYLNTNDSTCLDNTREGSFYKCKKSDKNNEFCEECVDGYFLDSENKCTLVKNCKISKNEKICEICEEYFCLNVKNGTCISNDYINDENLKFYFACNRTDEEGTTCEQCIEGYGKGEEGYCIDQTRCLEKEDGKCLRCTEELNEKGYSYCANDVFGCVETVDNECIRCDDLLHLYFCTECKEGYDLFYGGCVNMTELEEEEIQ